MVTAIERKIGVGALVKHDRIASNNELKDIPLVGAVERNRASCVVMALKLGESGRKALLEQIKIISEERRFWASKVGIIKRAKAKTRSLIFFTEPMTSVPAPAGIENSRNVFANTASSSLDAMVELCMTFLQRPAEDDTWGTRDPDTQEYYDCLLSLIKAADPLSCLPHTLAKLEEIKQRAFWFNSKSPELASVP